jgi:flagellar hook-basal body complex protein FliE
MQQSADQAVEQLVTGGDVNPAEVLTAVQKADLAFRMMIQVRNKMVQAYNEIQNMRV